MSQTNRAQGRQQQDGDYVRKSTMYMAVAVALVVGAFLGVQVTSLYSPAPVQEKRAVSAPSQQAQNGPANQISPDVMGRILEMEQAVLKDPNDVAAWTKLGHLYFDTDQPKKAIPAYEKSLALKPNDPDVLTDLGVMYREDHQHDRALATFEKAIAANPKHQIARFNKGIVLYFDLERKDDAMKAWRELLAINPDAKAPNGQPLKEMMQSLQQQSK
ncbi:tetratricopeptide repeat protein [Nitratidesulfovibrio sp. SRB-5]|uniref:tetratricopeptide repeat protein n=1 Tax=Nitratidesulfovibrio sp. SRB-5 TaxID=2872636 RepID=UPI0010260588|nr:tetratricopeptide repeat protein [Nitratidesulfovibrio sp. SRB-5]MBZ2172745.1 tetratricopeptide repeat protein [Nitratidesulfovibrio sp. SRB-5]RXF73409.1 tetratricopeptide repeat protein [Desulfovibrio sp. DS-1]